MADEQEGSNPEPDDADLIADLDGPDAFDGVLPEEPRTGAPPPAARPREREAAPAGDLPEDLKRDLVAEGLPVRAGEPENLARTRLVNHLKGKNASFLRESKETKRELAAIRQRTEEIFREQWRAAHGQPTEADLQRQREAAIPDIDLDPDGYAAWGIQQLLIEREQNQISQREYEQRKAELEQTQAAYNELDRQVGETIAYATGAQVDGTYGPPADQEAFDAYFYVITKSYDTFAAMYPTADHQTLEAMLAAQQQLDMRTLVAQGRDPIETMKAWARGQSGGRYREEVAAVRARHEAKKAGGRQQPAPRPAKNQNRRSAVSPSPSARSGAPTREVNPADMSEDEYVAAALAEKFDPSEFTVKNYGRRYGS